jgi:His Kinase A (phospho-acceptor) domain
VSDAGPSPGQADRFAALVTLACHDLRTPLATASGLAKTLIRAGELGGRDLRFVEMIDEASAQMALLIDQLGLAARIQSGRYDPLPLNADTLELAASSGDERIGAEGVGEIVETDALTVGRALTALAVAALRFGELTSVMWTVKGRLLTLSPLPAVAAPIFTGADPRDLGALVACAAIERLGGSVAVEGESLRVRI